MKYQQTQLVGLLNLHTKDKPQRYDTFTICHISSQLSRINRRSNGRKCVSIRDAHSLSLQQNAKIGFKTFIRAQSYLRTVFDKTDKTKDTNVCELNLVPRKPITTLPPTSSKSIARKQKMPSPEFHLDPNWRRATSEDSTTTSGKGCLNTPTHLVQQVNCTNETKIAPRSSGKPVCIRVAYHLVHSDPQLESNPHA